MSYFFLLVKKGGLGLQGISVGNLWNAECNLLGCCPEAEVSVTFKQQHLCFPNDNKSAVEQLLAWIRTHSLPWKSNTIRGNFPSEWKLSYQTDINISCSMFLLLTPTEDEGMFSSEYCGSYVSVPTKSVIGVELQDAWDMEVGTSKGVVCNLTHSALAVLQ